MNDKHRENDLVDWAVGVIEENTYLTLAASSLDGMPWVAPVAFAYDQDGRFYWRSHREALHSRLILANPEVAIVIFDSTVPEGTGGGVYFQATAEALEDPAEIDAAILLINGRREDSAFGVAVADQLSGTAFKRIYRATPRNISRTADGFQDGQRFSMRSPLDFLALQARLAHGEPTSQTK